MIPYAEPLAAELELFADRCECRRAFPMILSMIQASAMLHQRQRAMIEAGFLIAAPTDYEFTARLLAGPLGRSLGETLSDPARRFLDRVCTEIDDPDRPLPEPFTAADIRRRLNVGRSTVAGFLAEMADKGLLEQVDTNGGGRGRQARAWRVMSRDFNVVHILPPPTQFFQDACQLRRNAELVSLIRMARR